MTRRIVSLIGAFALLVGQAWAGTVNPPAAFGNATTINGSTPAAIATTGAWGSLTTAAPVLTDGPMWMHWFGTGVEADPGPNSFTVQGLHYYANLTINNGQTITVSNNNGTATSPTDRPQAGLVAFVSGTCTIAGTIAANAIVPAAAAGNANFGGGSAGGSGFGAANGTAGPSSNLPALTGVVQLVPGGAAGTSGVAGAVGGTPDVSAQRLFMSTAPAYSLMGGASGAQGGSAGGAGGAAGGAVYLICATISFPGTGVINVAGGNATAGGANTGGGGGGGGGFVVLAGHSVTNSGTITVTAGNGGAVGTGTSTAGGNGGPGWSSVITLQ